MRKLATNAIGGKDVVRGRWRTDKGDTGDEGLSATGTTVTKNHRGPNADASVRRVCGWNEVEDTVSPLGAKRSTLPALGRVGRLGAKRKVFQFWRGESGQY